MIHWFGCLQTNRWILTEQTKANGPVELNVLYKTFIRGQMFADMQAACVVFPVSFVIIPKWPTLPFCGGTGKVSLSFRLAIMKDHILHVHELSPWGEFAFFAVDTILLHPMPVNYTLAQRWSLCWLWRKWEHIITLACVIQVTAWCIVLSAAHQEVQSMTWFTWLFTI